ALTAEEEILRPLDLGPISTKAGERPGPPRLRLDEMGVDLAEARVEYVVQLREGFLERGGPVGAEVEDRKAPEVGLRVRLKRHQRVQHGRRLFLILEARHAGGVGQSFVRGRVRE